MGSIAVKLVCGLPRGQWWSAQLDKAGVLCGLANTAGQALGHPA